MKKWFFVMALAMALVTLPAQAAPQDIRIAHTGELTRVQNYLNSITTLVADFSQVAPDGSLASGKFYLKRPGKMRWQYNPPTPILMVASGSEMVYYDYDLQQVSHIPIDSTLASFLAKEKIDLFDPFITITDFTSGAGAVRLSLLQTNAPESGKLTLEFSDQPLQIRNMVVTDAQGQTTTVGLNNAEFGSVLEDKLFIFQDPRKSRH